MDRRRVKTQKLVELEKELNALKETFSELAKAYLVEDPKLMWAFYALLETDNFEMRRRQMERFYSNLVKLNILTEAEKQEAIYHLFEAPFAGYHTYGGVLFAVSDNLKDPKKSTLFINERTVLDFTFRAFLGKLAPVLSKVMKAALK